MSPPSLTASPKGIIRVLRLQRTDVQVESAERLSETSVVIGVSKAGKADFDFKLLGTEGTEPFEVTYTKDAILSQRAENAACSPKAWEVAIGRLLMGNEPDPETEKGMEPDELDGMEAVAAVEEGVALKITVRKRIEGFTQRLGTLTLLSSPDTEISLFDWCSLSLSTRDDDLKKQRSQRAEISSQKTQIEMLHAQLDALLTAKEEHDSEMLNKFAALLNEKKLKIRDQQRLLASASVDEQKVAAVVEARADAGESGGRRAKGRGKGKRKAVVEESESEDGFEKMAVDDDEDARVQEDVAADEGRMTEDEETVDEDSADDALPASVPAVVGAGAEGAAKPVPAVPVREKTPPRRELPFARKGARKAAPPPPPEDEETDSDDEL